MKSQQEDYLKKIEILRENSQALMAENGQLKTCIMKKDENYSNMETKLNSYKNENLELKKKMDSFFAKEDIAEVIKEENKNLTKELAS